jgi:hypothetical protein
VCEAAAGARSAPQRETAGSRRNRMSTMPAPCTRHSPIYCFRVDRTGLGGLRRGVGGKELSSEDIFKEGERAGGKNRS